MKRQPIGFLSLILLCIAIASPPLTAAGGLPPDISAAASALQPWLVSTRRALHRMPELGFEEHKTSSYLQDVLQHYNITYSTGHAGTGIIATIGSGTPVVLLRADIDALPVEEPEGFEARSEHPGRMHACGHDTHMAMLLGAARVLKNHHDAVSGGLTGTVKLVFQPYEEGGAGADVILKTGALDDVEAAFGMHIMPHIRTGVFATRPGTIMAGSFSFHVTITGRGGHAAMPHVNIDPVVAAASLITSLQTLVSRETSPLGSGVVSVTLLRAGDGAYNVIPDAAHIGGTIRALDHAHLLRLQSRLQAMAVSVAQAYGCNATVDWMQNVHPVYPPTVNDKGNVEFSRSVAAGLFAPGDIEEAEPLMAGEDFAFYCLKVPCTYAFLGIRNETAGSVYALHSPKFTMDETVLHKGTALHVAWALAYLQQAHGKASSSDKEEL